MLILCLLSSIGAGDSLVYPCCGFFVEITVKTFKSYRRRNYAAAGSGRYELRHFFFLSTVALYALHICDIKKKKKKMTFMLTAICKI